MGAFKNRYVRVDLSLPQGTSGQTAAPCPCYIPNGSPKMDQNISNLVFFRQICRFILIFICEFSLYLSVSLFIFTCEFVYIYLWVCLHLPVSLFIFTCEFVYIYLWVCLLPPTNKVCEGYVFTPVCQSLCSQGGTWAGTSPGICTRLGRSTPSGR